MDKLRSKVTWFNDTKGYGFISASTPKGSIADMDIFVHYVAIKGEGFKTLEEGDLVEFELINGPKGPIATGVELLESTSTPITQTDEGEASASTPKGSGGEK